MTQRDDRSDTLAVVVLPDGGHSYLSKVYDDEWMCENGFRAAVQESSRELTHAHSNGRSRLIAAME